MKKHYTEFLWAAVMALFFWMIFVPLISSALSTYITSQGGTGTTTPSGILYGDNGATNHLNTVTIGSNLTFTGGTLSATGGSGTVSTSTVPTIGQLPYWTGNGTPSTLGSIATGTASFSSPLTGGPFTIIGTGGSIGCQTASGSQAGCLSSSDWTTFNGKASFSGTTGQVDYFSGTNTAVGTSTIFITPAGNVGIGTSTPDSSLTFAQSTASTGGIDFGGDVFLYRQGSGNFTIAAPNTANLNLTPTVTNKDATITFNPTGSSNASSGKIVSVAHPLKLQAGFPSVPQITIDYASSNTGIGTTSPIATFTIQGTGSTNPFVVASSSGSQLLTVLANGNVGIGTSGPGYKLDVQGSSAIAFNAQTSGVNSVFRLQNTSATGWSAADVYDNSNVQQAGFGYANPSSSNTALTNNGYFWTRSGTNFVIDAGNLSTPSVFVNGTSGNVGIGTTTPNANLYVNGSIGSNASSTAISIPIATSTANYIRVTDTSATRTITLPLCNGATLGNEYQVKDSTGGAATNNITVSRNGTDTIDGGTSAIINTNYGTVRVKCGAIGAWDVMYSK